MTHIDIFIIFHNRKKVSSLVYKLNSLHPSLQFTVEHEHNSRLDFLDLTIICSPNGSLKTTVQKENHLEHTVSVPPTFFRMNVVF